MNAAELRELIKQALPQLVREDSEIQELILRLSRQEFAPRQSTEDRFERLFAKLERITEDGNRRWEENQAELRRMREESERRFQEHQQEFNRVHEEIMAMARKHDRTVGALGSRWGLASEKAFRDALASVLEENFDVRVVNVNEYDDQGTVFGRPEQIELDVIVTNGTLILMELKSSIDKAGMYIFERKARFYEQRHDRKADRLIVISPMIDARARRVGERLGIEMFGDSMEMDTLDKS